MSSRSLTFKRLAGVSLTAVLVTASLDAVAAPQRKKKQNRAKTTQVAAAPTVEDESGRKMRTEGTSVLQIVLNAPISAEKINAEALGLQAFDNVLVTASDRYVNRVSMFTGVSPWNSGVSSKKEDWRWAQALRGHTNLFDLFYESGYTTVLVGDGLFGQTDGESGIKWDHQLDAEVVGQKRDADSVRLLQNWLSQPATSPFFATIVLQEAEGLETQLQALMELAKTHPKLRIAVVGGESAASATQHEAPYEQWFAIQKGSEKANSERLGSSVDWYATLCQLAGLKAPSQVEGLSLLQSSKQDKRVSVTLMEFSETPRYHVRGPDWVAVGAAGQMSAYGLNAEEAWKPIPEEERQERQAAEAALPKAWAKTRREKQEIRWEGLADGSIVYHFQPGDQVPAEESPDLLERGLEIEIEFTYAPQTHKNAVLISQGNAQLGFAIHLIQGVPAVTVRYDGLQSTLRMKEALKAGNQHLKAIFSVDGTLRFGSKLTAQQALGFTPFDGGFPRKFQGPLLVGFEGEVLGREKFPQKGDFLGKITDLYYCVLPGLTVETRAAKAVPVE